MIKNLLLLTGSDDYRLGARVLFYKKGFRAKYEEGEIEFFDEKSSFHDFESSVLTPNLFGSKRLIFTQGFWTPEHFEIAQKIDFFARLPDHQDLCTVIAVEPILDKRKKSSKFLLDQARVEHFDPMEEAQIIDWIINQTQARNGSIQMKDARGLLARCGENLWNLSNEIDKLLQADENQTITADLIEDLTLPHPKVVIWDFVAAVSQQNTAKALKLFQDLCTMGESPHQIFAMIIREVRIHAQLRSGLDQGWSAKVIASESKLHPFVVQKTLSLTRNFDLAQIRLMYADLVDIDHKLKTGGLSVSTDDQGELELALEKFIVDHGKK